MSNYLPPTVPTSIGQAKKTQVRKKEVVVNSADDVEDVRLTLTFRKIKIREIRQLNLIKLILIIFNNKNISF